MATSSSFSMDGWYGRAGKVWYPTSGSLQSITSNGTINHVVSSPTLNNSTSTSGNKYTTVLAFTTPSDSTISSITSITVSWYQAKLSTSSGTVYGTITSSSPFNWSTSSDTVTTYRNNAVSGSIEGTVYSTSSGYTQVSMTITGTFSTNTRYYLILYTKDTNHQYQINPSTSSRPISATVEYTIKTYKITYDANGGSGSTASQTVTAGGSVNLRSNGFTPPTTAVHGITLKDSDGTALSSSTYSTFKNNAFYRWIIGSSYYAAGAAYTPTSNVTAKASWSTNYTLKKVTKSPTTTTGFTITYNPNGGTCSKTSETMTDTTTYEHTKWISGTYEYEPTATLGGPAAYTFTVKYTTTTTKGSTTLPTPTNKSTSTLKIAFNYQGGSGTPTSANSTKTITKTFKGWATSSTATTGSTGSYTPSSNVTLYAIWGTSTTKYSAISLPTPTRVGYKFLGWATSASASSGVTGSYTPTSDGITTLFAIWEPNGNVCIYINSTDKYKTALVYVYAPSSTDDIKPWKLAIPYLYTSGTQPWKIIAG